MESCIRTNQSIVDIQENTDQRIDLYKILGLNQHATYEEIKKQWIQFAMIYHPDKCCDDYNDMFRKVSLAYKVLSNPEKRKKYNLAVAAQLSESSLYEDS